MNWRQVKVQTGFSSCGGGLAADELMADRCVDGTGDERKRPARTNNNREKQTKNSTNPDRKGKGKHERTKG